MNWGVAWKIFSRRLVVSFGRQLMIANLFSETDYQLYKDEFLKLFGFGVKGVDYDAEGAQNEI